jgi:hypothetical protein
LAVSLNFWERIKPEQFGQRGCRQLLVNPACFADFLLEQPFGELAVGGVEAAMNQLAIDSEAGIINTVR